MARRRPLFIKVCGMMYPENVAAIATLGVSRIGFIFSAASPRYVGRFPVIPKWQSGSAKRIGVFVDAPLEGVVEVARQWSLDGVQLHGSESPEYCHGVRSLYGGELIKAIAVDSEDPSPIASRYEGSVDILLFDTKGASPGGTGRVFDWRLLRPYHLRTPFIVAGGIDESTVRGLECLLENEQLYGIDLNSRLEDAVGHKDPTRVREVIRIVEHELLRRRRGLLR